MFASLKNQFYWNIISTLFTGIIIGVFLSMLDYNEESITLLSIIGIISVFSLVLITVFWNLIINQINLYKNIIK